MLKVFVHGDYCDNKNAYVTKFEDFTDNEERLQTFVKTVNETGGGDVAECYELALKEIREKLSWRPGEHGGTESIFPVCY